MNDSTEAAVSWHAYAEQEKMKKEAHLEEEEQKQEDADGTDQLEEAVAYTEADAPEEEGEHEA